MHTRRALLTGVSAAAAMAVAGALTPAEGAKASLPTLADAPRLWAAQDEIGAYLAELRNCEGVYGEYDALPALRHISIESSRYTAQVEAMLADLVRQLEA